LGAHSQLDQALHERLAAAAAGACSARIGHAFEVVRPLTNGFVDLSIGDAKAMANEHGE